MDLMQDFILYLDSTNLNETLKAASQKYFILYLDSTNRNEIFKMQRANILYFIWIVQMYHF